MTKNEWIDVVSWMQVNWAHRTFEPTIVKKQYELVADTDAAAAFAAVKSVGDQPFPPTPLAIARMAAELSQPPVPDFDEVVSAFRLMVRKGGGHWDATTAPAFEDWGTHNLPERIAEFFDRPRWRLWCTMPEGDTTFYAQQRDEWKASRGRVERQRRLLAVGVDRAALEGPRRLDPARLLGDGA